MFNFYTSTQKFLAFLMDSDTVTCKTDELAKDC